MALEPPAAELDAGTATAFTLTQEDVPVLSAPSGTEQIDVRVQARRTVGGIVYDARDARRVRFFLEIELREVLEAQPYALTGRAAAGVSLLLAQPYTAHRPGRCGPEPHHRPALRDHRPGRCRSEPHHRPALPDPARRPLMFTFVSNNPADFGGGAYKTTRAGSFRSSRVSHAIEMHGTASTMQSKAILGFQAVAGSVTWVHAQVGFFGSTNSAPQDHSNADGNMFFAARDASGAIVAEFTVVDGKLKIRAYGSSTADSGTYSLSNLSSSTLHALDVKIDLSGGNIAVEAYLNAVDASAAPFLSVSVANSATPRTNPMQLEWRAYDLADHSAHTAYQQISEVMVGDEDTRGLGLTDLMTFGAGTHADWVGDPAGLTDGDDATGVSTATLGARVSRAVATYGGPASAAVRGLFIPARGSAEAGDVRAFLRDIAGATDHAAAAGYGLPAGAIGYGLAEFALNPATGLPWDTGDLTGFEYGLEAV